MMLTRKKMTMLIVLSIILGTMVQFGLGEDYKVVYTTHGGVRGQKKTQDYKKITPGAYVYTYLGIPYAKPPVGDLRFKKPELANPWKETLNADKMAPACVQHTSYPYPWFDQEPGQSEDCLYLNIYETPKRTTETDIDGPRPVFFVIHGGGFLGGSNRMIYYDGEYTATDWVENDDLWGAIVVTFNYRLGAFGFLTTDTEDAPGNIAMYDMHLALQWVNENIEAFNGNPDDIVLYGTGAGSVAVSLFCMSYFTEGLFTAAILHSGTFVSHKENSLENNVKLSASLAKAVNCSASEEEFRAKPKVAVACLQGVDANELAATLDALNPSALELFYPQYDGRLFPKDPVQALKDNKFNDVAIYMGNSATEGSLILTNRYPEEFGRFGEKNQGIINTTFATSILTEVFKSYPNPDEIVNYFLNDISYAKSQTTLQNTIRAITYESTYCPAVYFAEKYGDKYGRVTVQEYYFRPPGMPWAEWMGSVPFNDAPYMLGSCFVEETEEHKYDENQLTVGFIQRLYNFVFARDGYVMYLHSHGLKFDSNNHGYDFVGDTEETFTTVQDFRYNLDGCDYLRKYHGF